jgi:hypothetical protein
VRPLLRLRGDLGPSLRLGNLAERLVDIERILTFLGDMTVLSQIADDRSLDPLEDLGEFATPLSRREMRRLTVAFLQTDLAIRVSRPEASLATWWIGTGEADVSRLMLPPRTVRLSYENPIEVVVAVAATITTGVAWTLNKIQEARRAESEIARNRAEETKVRVETELLVLDSVVRVHELGQTVTLTEEVLRELLPGMPPETARAILASAHGSRAVRALHRLPPAIEAVVDTENDDGSRT